MTRPLILVLCLIWFAAAVGAADAGGGVSAVHRREPTFILGLWKMMAQSNSKAFVGAVVIDRTKSTDVNVVGTVVGDGLVIPFTIPRIRIGKMRSAWTLVQPPEADGPVLYCGTALAPAYVRTLSLLGDSVGFQTVDDVAAVRTALTRFLTLTDVAAAATAFRANDDSTLRCMLADRLLAEPFVNLPDGLTSELLAFALDRKQPLALRTYAVMRAGEELPIGKANAQDALALTLIAVVADIHEDGWLRLPALDALERAAKTLTPKRAAELKSVLTTPGIFRDQDPLQLAYNLRSDGSMYLARNATDELRSVADRLIGTLTTK